MEAYNLPSRSVVAILCASGLFCGCTSSRPPNLIVGSKDSTAQIIIGEIIAQQIERRLARPVDRRLGLITAASAHQALLSGEIHLYSEDVGSARAAAFHFAQTPDPEILKERVLREYRNIQMEFLAPLGFSNAWVLCVAEKFGKENSIATLSQARKYTKGWRMAASSEFIERDDGQAALQGAYSLSWAASPRSVDRKTAYQQVLQPQFNVLAGNITDAALLSNLYRILEDDKHVFGAHDQGIVVRSEKLLEYPGLKQALLELTGKFDVETLRRLSAAVEEEQRPLAKVASEFLQKH
jgi:glycine betaine/choline ABC-type transport system substrate-binding protein